MAVIACHDGRAAHTAGQKLASQPKTASIVKQIFNTHGASGNMPAPDE